MVVSFGILMWGLSSRSQPIYLNKAAERGIDTKKDLSTIGNGVSFRDFNGDGWDDITMGTEAGKTIDFYINAGGTFIKIDPLIQNRDEVKQILWVDFDNDGDQDLYIATAEAPNRLYERTDSLELVDITPQTNLSLKANTSYGAIWGDYNRDGLLDLYYSDRKTGNAFDQTETQYNRNQLYLNNGNGTFLKVSINSNSEDSRKIPFCSAFFDFNNDSWPDIYTANDKLTTNTLLKNDRNCGFIDVGHNSQSDVKMNAMCVAIGDYNNDGWQDIYITNTPVGNKLLMNVPDDDIFHDATLFSGTEYLGNGWGSIFLDADNDGFQDLYVSGSMVGADAISNVFYRNLGNGKFETADFGFVGDTTSSYANAHGDYNQDGYPDIIVQNNKPFQTQLWENSGYSNHWLKIKLNGVVSNRDAVGSLIKLYTSSGMQTRYTHCGIGFLGQNTLDVMFGIGNSEIVDSLLVFWPSGHTDHFYGVAADQRLIIDEGSYGIFDSINYFSTYCSAYKDDDHEDFTSEEVDTPLGMKDHEIKVYPNPAGNQIFITSPVEESLSFRIIDLSGKLIIEKKAHTGPVSLSNLLPQVYIIRVTCSERVVHTSLFVKN